MILEAFLLLAALIFVPALQLPLLWNCIVFAVVLLLVLPGMRMALTQSPPLVPTPMPTVKRMLDLAHAQKGDKVVDLGCGDGRIVRAAAERGAVAVGYDLSIPTLLLAWLRIRSVPGASLRYGDIFRQNYSDADVICCYLLQSVMQKFEEKIWPTLQPGCRVVSHAFRMKSVTPAAEENGVVLYVKH